MRILKTIIPAYILLAICCTAKAQSTVTVASLPLDSAIQKLVPVMTGKVPPNVRIFGIGNISHFAKETVRFNSALAAYLISRENFRQFILFDNDWLLRPLAGYLHGDETYSEAKTDSLFRLSLGSTQYCTAELRSFIHWLKQYNMANPADKVMIAGLLPEEPIPASYFLATYISAADRARAAEFAASWGDDIYNTGKPWSDIRQWFADIRKNAATAATYKDLLSQCGKDLLYNDVVQRRSAIRPGTAEFIRARMQINAEWILKNADKRTILFTGNEYAARSEAMLSGHKAASYALHLHRNIGDAYFASLTDFSGSATLDLINPADLSMKPVVLQPTNQAADMSAAQSVFFLSDNKVRVEQYQPRTIFPIAGQERPFFPSPSLAVADVIFILRDLSNARLLEAIR